MFKDFSKVKFKMFYTFVCGKFVTIWCYIQYEANLSQNVVMCNMLWCFIN